MAKFTMVTFKKTVPPDLVDCLIKSMKKRTKSQRRLVSAEITILTGKLIIYFNGCRTGQVFSFLSATHLVSIYNG